ncbi:2-amino-4-hydroxy-6-hydroxymethyldihydropteridine diphosphokinase [Brucepastera parasyntrophica]|uniref:2-amino-4-hydroxy-6- hydroxymethyldihydropteridine diphosphokinase n=1 Tax=Brucepastera parasyntrophica TaxID=2880008 RepID=UPI002109A2E4|nr:2-amino-4-hydroxy-6-hydroxymethyldihydropteridine diphosphokinase [Brucepastera parasyntrophica]ULQ59899.1 2-amino-4-hydroxy-6-hydroxymethyldihydropteridine diphosphokinase [Brucepastera parasyntrophica]
MIEKPPVDTVLSLGSNCGDSPGILKEAVSLIGAFLTGLNISSVYKTVPQDCPDQPDFLNLAVRGCFAETADILLRKIQGIETGLGRDRNTEKRYGPRTLDIDIILFGNAVIRQTDLIIPHERMKKRQFVLIPLLEIYPEAADPVSGEPFRIILESLPDQGVTMAGSLFCHTM